MNPEIIKYYNESPEVEEWLNAPGGKPFPLVPGYDDKEIGMLFNLSEKLLEISQALEKKGDAGTASYVWSISTELFRMACRHNADLSDRGGRGGRKH